MTIGPVDKRHETIERRLLTRRQAASYCGLSLQGFSEWIKRGKLPGPIPGTHRWDRKAIDVALDHASGLMLTMDDPFDDWKARRDARGSQGHP
jgi:predicted DNA-binding transcriptional regulator AlpA